MCYCILIRLLNSQCSVLSRSAFTLPCGIRIDFSLSLYPRPASPRPPRPFCRGVGDLNRITFQKGRDQPGPGLGSDVTSRAISPGFAEMVAAGLAQRSGNGWKFPFPGTSGKVLKGALHLMGMGLSASSFFPSVPSAPHGSPHWGSSPQPPAKSPRFPSSCKTPSYFLLAVGSWRDWSLVHLDAEQQWMVKQWGHWSDVRQKLLNGDVSGKKSWLMVCILTWHFSS